MTDREKLIEAMARAMHDARPPMDVEGKPLDFEDPANCTSMNCTHDAAAALSAIEAMGATVVPVEATEEMSEAGWVRLCDHTHLTAEDIYTVMIAASPFAKENT
jgi:hypothetical protein